MANVMTNFSKGPQYQCQNRCLAGGQTFHADKHKANTVKSLFFPCVSFSNNYSILLFLKNYPDKQYIMISDLSYCNKCSEILVVMHSISKKEKKKN